MFFFLEIKIVLIRVEKKDNAGLILLSFHEAGNTAVPGGIRTHEASKAEFG